MKRLVIASACLSLVLPLAASASAETTLRGARLILAAGPPGGVPPGLAKKPYGLPPGQAKKMWLRGQNLPAIYYNDAQYFITQPQRYRLPSAPPGYRWVLVEDNAYLVQNSNGLVANVIANAVANLIR
jgi:hypothetical protein